MSVRCKGDSGLAGYFEIGWLELADHVSRIYATGKGEVSTGPDPQDGEGRRNTPTQLRNSRS
jgi:hypothetical protein